MGYSMGAQSAEEVPLATDFEPETTKLKFWIDGRFAALKGVIEGFKTHGREQTRGPEDYDAFADERRFYQKMLHQQQNGGHGSINGDRRGWLRDAVIVVTLALSGWTLKTVIEQGQDIARMQCQLSPSTCMQVQDRAQR